MNLIENNKLDKSNLVLISISEPVIEGYEDEQLTDDYINGFKDVLRVKFWDIEEDSCNYKIISDETARLIQQFILKNIDNRFILHCRAGMSRSAGVGRAIECIKFFGIGEKAKYEYKTSFNSEITAHSRYRSNLTVFDKIVKQY
jgi:predicted protein tyrosine phosphatase